MLVVQYASFLFRYDCCVDSEMWLSPMGACYAIRSPKQHVDALGLQILAKLPLPMEKSAPTGGNFPNNALAFSLTTTGKISAVNHRYIATGRHTLAALHLKVTEVENDRFFNGCKEDVPDTYSKGNADMRELKKFQVEFAE